MKPLEKGKWILGLLVLGTAMYHLRKRQVKAIPYHPFLEGRKPLVMAHRGGQGIWPPNTLFAFEQAARLGVDVLELDIHSTADGALVVRHDDTVDRTTNGTGLIREKTLAELKILDAGYRWTADGGKTYPFRNSGIKIPTLEEILQAFPTMKLNIDIKPPEAGIVERFVEMLERYDRTRNVLVGSFHDHQLTQFRALSPETATAAGVRETQIFFVLTLIRLSALYRPSANAFQIPEHTGRLRVITPRFIQAAHDHNLEVHVWTVNEEHDIQRLLDWGADGIITDYPNRLLPLINQSILK